MLLTLDNLFLESCGIAFASGLSDTGKIVTYNQEKEFIVIAIPYIDDNNKLLFMTYDLDYHFLSLEIGEIDRKNRIKIMNRNFNGDIYIFQSNLKNLTNRYLDYYLDYYKNILFFY